VLAEIYVYLYLSLGLFLPCVRYTRSARSANF